MSARRRERVVVGVDGGATTTDVLVATLDGAVIGSATVGGSNHETIGVERMVQVIADGVDAALASAARTRDDVAAYAFGLAGVDWDSDVTTVSTAIEGLGLDGAIMVVNDSIIALRAGCSAGWGIVSCVGTATVTAGIGRDGRRARTMAIGWGEPSGSWSLVTESLHAIAAAHHGTRPPTLLRELYLDALGARDVASMFESITRRRSTIGAHLAPLVTDADALGDPIARGIIIDTAVRHAEMVVAVASQLELVDGSFEVVTSGGVHRGVRRFADVFAERVQTSCPQASIIELHTAPAVGAIQLALDSLSNSTPLVTDPRAAHGSAAP